MTTPARRTAVVLFNLGAPDSLGTVAPFLTNLFSDPAILQVPGALRWVVARLIAYRRGGTARAIYARLGGGSPLLAHTEDQAAALALALADLGEVRVVPAMRYWHPRAAAVAHALTAWQPDEIVLLPLYPQFSTTTTGSSLAEWRRVARAAGLACPTTAVCCYPVIAEFIEAHVAATAAVLRSAGDARVLFSAHGLPEKIVARGDPYQWQVEATARAVAQGLAANGQALDWSVCYQSRVGPLQWIGPSTVAEIARAGRDGKALVVVPIAFVSEHAETLVELDEECRALAERCGVPAYHRVAALGTAAVYISALARLVRGVLGRAGVWAATGPRTCPDGLNGCALAGRE
ncbi:MAG: ferrochelatase [Alphaproteobacteria bacterium]|nr:ferrochelatase [Alphaproteobacteria bacterium]